MNVWFTSTNQVRDVMMLYGSYYTFRKCFGFEIHVERWLSFKTKNYLVAQPPGPWSCLKLKSKCVYRLKLWNIENGKNFKVCFKLSPTWNFSCPFIANKEIIL